MITDILEQILIFCFQATRLASYYSFVQAAQRKMNIMHVLYMQIKLNNNTRRSFLTFTCWIVSHHHVREFNGNYELQWLRHNNWKSWVFWEKGMIIFSRLPLKRWTKVCHTQIYSSITSERIGSLFYWI